MLTPSYYFSLLRSFVYMLCLFMGFGVTPLFAGTLQCHLKSLKKGVPIALVIANNQYRGETLRQSLNDAEAMKKLLTSNGFQVIFKTNLDEKAMNKATYQFSECLKITRGVGLFYFTGYGMQLDGRNYLLPVDVDIRDKMDVKFDTFPIRKLFRRLSAAKNSLNIIILDASHKNPYPVFDKPGLTRESPINLGFVIASSTQESINTMKGTQNAKKAKKAKNSLYMRELIKALENAMQNHTRIEDVFMQVDNAVEQKSRGLQVPWYNSSLEKPFYFGKYQHQPQHALVVGINQYQSDRLGNLAGAVNDAKLLRDTLRHSPVQLPEKRVLLDARATRSAFIQAWQDMVKQAKPGDTLVLTYAGFSKQQPDTAPFDEKDNQDEILIFHDFNPKHPTQGRITDDELYSLFKQASEYKILFIVDGCDWGGNDDVGMLPAHVTMITAAQGGLVPETVLGNKSHGALSWFFAQALTGKADYNKNGRLERYELEIFLKEKVVKHMGMGAKPIPSLFPRGDNVSVFKY